MVLRAQMSRGEVHFRCFLNLGWRISQLGDSPPHIFIVVRMEPSRLLVKEGLEFFVRRTLLYGLVGRMSIDNGPNLLGRERGIQVEPGHFALSRPGPCRRAAIWSGRLAVGRRRLRWYHQPGYWTLAHGSRPLAALVSSLWAWARATKLSGPSSEFDQGNRLRNGPPCPHRRFREDGCWVSHASWALAIFEQRLGMAEQAKRAVGGHRRRCATVPLETWASGLTAGHGASHGRCDAAFSGHLARCSCWFAALRNVIGWARLRLASSHSWPLGGCGWFGGGARQHGKTLDY